MSPPNTTNPAPRGESERWVNCDLLPAELALLADCLLGVAADLRATGDLASAETVGERIGELQLLLALGAAWAAPVPETAR